MSLINTGVDSAIAIAERRRGKLGAALFAGRPESVFLRNVYALKSSNWLVVLSGFVEPVFYLLAFGMIVRWRVQMWRAYRALLREPRAADAPKS